MKQSSSEEIQPHKCLVYGALISAQVIFGISAVVGTIGLPSFHPLTFALVRESNATLLLLLAAHFVSIYAGREGGLMSGSLKDWKLIIVSGLGIFMSQAFYIVGIKLSSAVAASVWQPSQPILTAAVCIALGWEPFNCKRVVGILVAFLGCSIMVLGGGGTASGESLGGGGDEYSGAFSNLMGQFSFLINCFGSSLYVLASKRVLATNRYESITVTAWSYLAATFMMAVFAVVMSWSEPLSKFLCYDCGGSIWNVPRNAIPALIFYIIMTSSTAYGLITWANKYATGTLVIGYTVLQPMASAAMIQALVTLGLYDSCSIVEQGRFLIDELVKPCLDEPDRYTAIGAMGVLIGLMVIIRTEPKGDANSLDPDEIIYDTEDEELELSLLEKSFLDDDEDLESMEGLE
jgi:drug/metabolite transporter (DMT)-like permease